MYSLWLLCLSVCACEFASEFTVSPLNNSTAQWERSNNELLMILRPSIGKLWVWVNINPLLRVHLIVMISILCSICFKVTPETKVNIFFYITLLVYTFDPVWFQIASITAQRTPNGTPKTLSSSPTWAVSLHLTMTVKGCVCLIHIHLMTLPLQQC